MSLVTISNQYASGAEELAKMLSEFAGFRLIKKREIEKKLRGVVGEFLAGKFVSEKEPTFLDKYIYDMELWKSHITEAILSFGLEGRVIILGRGGGAILAGVPGCLNVLVVGKRDERIRYLAGKEKIDHLKSEEKIDRIDTLKAGFWRYHFGIDWPDPGYFDITLNPLKIGVERSARTLSVMVDALSLEDDFKGKGKKEIQRKYTVISAENLIVLTTGIGSSLFNVTVERGKKMKIRFSDVPADLRKRATRAVVESFKDYSVQSVI